MKKLWWLFCDYTGYGIGVERLKMRDKELAAATEKLVERMGWLFERICFYDVKPDELYYFANKTAIYALKAAEKVRITAYKEHMVRYKSLRKDRDNLRVQLKCANNKLDILTQKLNKKED